VILPDFLTLKSNLMKTIKKTRNPGKSGDFTERDNGTINKTGTWELMSDRKKITIGISLSASYPYILYL
jgi:hypothetical protein